MNQNIQSSGEGPKDMDNDGDDVSMTCEEDEEGRSKGKTATSRWNEKLYAVEGMLNTKMKKAEKKRRKKAEKSIPEDAMDDDYDFKVDYVRKRSAMDVGDEDDGNQIIGKVPMSGIEFTDE